MNSIRKGLAAAAALTLLTVGFTACGDSQPEEKYTSPSFQTETVKKGEQYTEATEAVELIPSGLSEGDPVNVSDVEADLNTNAAVVGIYDGNSYYNPFMGFVINTDGVLWKLYDAAGVAAATGQTEDDVNNLWYGVTSPYSLKNTTCAIAYDADTGSNLIISYVNPKLYYMQDMTAHEYLEMSARQYEGVEVKEMDYLGGVWSYMELEEEREGFGRRAQFASRKDDLIVLITYTLQGEDTLEDAASHVTRLISD